MPARSRSSLPSEGSLPAPTAGELHQRRDVAESFGADAARYDRSRPSYPPALVDRIVATSPGPDVLDVGVGTGIVARLLRDAGCRVVGVDADQRMAEFARRSGLHVEVARLEDWDAGGRLFDAVVAGQTWHWVEPVAGAAKAASLLRPGGLLALFWNADLPPADLTAAFGEVYRRVAPDSLVARRWVGVRSTLTLDSISGLAHGPVEAVRHAGAFSAPEEWRFDWERRYTKDEWLDQVPSTGDHSKLPRPQLDELLAGIGEAIDAVGGEFVMPYTTVAVAAVRR